MAIGRWMKSRSFAKKAARSQAMAAEAGYRGMKPSDVPIDPADPSPSTVSDGFAHYASKEQLAYSKETGHPVQALCGRVWVPSKDPTGIPVCPRCEATFKAMPERPLEPRRP